MAEAANILVVSDLHFGEELLPGATTERRTAVELGARAAQYDPRRSSAVRLLFSPFAAFVKQYFLKQGFRDGRVGLLMCLGLAYGNAIKQMLKMAWDMERPEDRA